jgi:hypothetical protein
MCACLCVVSAPHAFGAVSEDKYPVDYLFVGQKLSCSAFIADSKLMALHPSPHEDLLKRWSLS